MKSTSGIFGLFFLLGCTLTFPSQAQNRMVDLALSPDVTIVGVEAGEAVSATSPGNLVGELRVISADVSGDGVSDIIIALPLADDPAHERSNAGRVYVVFGQRDIASGTTLDLQSTPPNVIIYGASAGDELGTSVATGDVNGDGVRDIIVGAPNADEGDRPNVGKAYVIFGGTALMRSALRDMASPSAGPDVTMIGWGGTDKKNQDMAGRAVASGDINGDGVDDVVVGAPGLQGPDGRRQGQEGLAPDGGAVYVFFGSRNLASGTVRDASMPLPSGVNMVVYGRLGNVRLLPAPLPKTDVGEALGSALAVADVDGDGLADISIGAPNSSGVNDDRLFAGAVYVIRGRRKSLTEAPTSQNGGIFDNDQRSGQGRRVGLPPDMIIYGADAGDFVGSTLTAGDITGDNRADIVIGTSAANGPNNSRLAAGEVHVIFGATTLTTPRDLAAGADFSLFGADRFDRLGFSVAIGHVGGDAIPDLIIGAPTADGMGNSRPSAGEVYVVFGRSSLRGTLDFSQPNQRPDVTIVGAKVPDQVGYSVAVGNFDGAGPADVIATGPFASGGLQESKLGLTYVIFGGF